MFVVCFYSSSNTPMLPCFRRPLLISRITTSTILLLRFWHRFINSFMCSAQNLSYNCIKNRTPIYIVSSIYNATYFCLKQPFIIDIKLSKLAFQVPYMSQILNQMLSALQKNYSRLKLKRQSRNVYHAKLLEPKSFWESERVAVPTQKLNQLQVTLRDLWQSIHRVKNRFSSFMTAKLRSKKETILFTFYEHQIVFIKSLNEKKMCSFLGDVLNYPWGISGLEIWYLKS